MDFEKIKKQVEFYFSDSNYRDDKFLRQQALLNDGYIPISTLITFKRLRDLGADVESVKKAVTDSKIVELKDDNIKKIETEEYKKMLLEDNLIERCLFISGIDVDLKLEDIESMLSSYMTPLVIRMRKDKSKKFNGTVFVELKSKEDVEKCLELEIPCGDHSEESIKRKRDEKGYLKIQKKADFLKEKKKIDEETSVEEAKKNLVRDFMDKVFKYECKNKDLEIHQIKKIVQDVSFVDKNANTLRFKFKKDFTSKTVGENDEKIELTKLSEEEVKKYCEGINVKPKDKKQKWNKKSKK